MAYHIKFIIMIITFQPPIFVNELSDVIKLNDNEKVTVFHSDVYLLLNQKRIESYNKTDIDKYFTLNTPSADTSKFTDEQLMDTIKSRRIQSPSDLKKWSDFIDNCTFVFKDNVAKNARDIYTHSSKASKSSNDSNV